MTSRSLAGLFLALGMVAPLRAQDPKLPDVATFDKTVVDVLRDVHNKGADLFNTSKDYAGAYRLYQGALITVRPLLAHRTAAQKFIDEGLLEAEKESMVATKAFKLHETIEAVRSHLKTPNEPIKKPVDPKKKPDDPDPKKKPDDPKKKPDEVSPKPKEKQPAPTGGTSGKVTFKGQPLPAGEVSVVTLDQAKPLVFTATIDAAGNYDFKPPLPPGRYAVIVTAKAVPEKYSTTTTSGLVIDVKPGANSINLDLK